MSGGVVAPEPVAPDGAAGGVLAVALIDRLRARGLTVGTAESLTGGMVAAALTSVPGASAVVCGGIIAYTHDMKSRVLGVDSALLASAGAVDPRVALAMAEGACRVLGCELGLATTGVAGPDPSDGKPVGTVHIAACMSAEDRQVREVASLQLAGDREAIRTATVREVLGLALRVLPA